MCRYYTMVIINFLNSNSRWNYPVKYMRKLATPYISVYWLKLSYTNAANVIG